MNGVKKNKNLQQGTTNKPSKKEGMNKSSASMKKEYGDFGQNEKNTRSTDTLGKKTNSTKKTSPKMNSSMERDRTVGTGARNFEGSEKRTSNFDKSFKNDCNCRCNDKKCK